MSQGDDFLLDLFREEVRSHAQAIADGLVALEQGNTGPERLEAMMRAAHSIKGAARVVNVQPAVEVAHAMEDCFVLAQKGQCPLSGETVDVLLSGVDTLRRIAEAAGSGFASWMESAGSEVAAAAESLQVVARQAKESAGSRAAQTADAKVDRSPAAARDGVPPTEATRGLQAERPEMPLPLGSPPASKGLEPIPERTPVAEAPTPLSQLPYPSSAVDLAPGRPAVAAAASATPSDESTVRVTARSLTRLMGLAGESLVGARWLQPFSKSLLQLKRRQAQLGDALELLRDAVVSGDATEDVRSLVDDAREHLRDCLGLLSHRIDEFDTRVQATDDLTARLYREVISSRMRPFRDGVQGLPRLVRDLARQLGKKAQLHVIGETTEVDRDVLERLDAPLNHLLRNALDHGLEGPEQRRAAGKPEVGQLRIEAAHHAGMLSIIVSDDGGGIDVDRLRRKVVERGHTTAELADRLSQGELLDFLFLPGFSTAKDVTEISGRGVGLDVVHAMVQSVGGHVHIQTQTGRGTSFRLELPVTLSVLRAVIVEIAGEPYAMPHNRIDRVIRMPRDRLRSLENRQYVEVDGQNIGLVLARQVFQLDGPDSIGEDLFVVLFSRGGDHYGLVVDGLRGEQDLVVRPLDRRLGKVPNIHAAAILDDGSAVLIVDLDDMRRSIDKLLQGGRLQRTDVRAPQTAQMQPKRILVVDDSITVREVERQLLTNHGYSVEVAVDGMEGWNLVREGRFDLVVCDIDMPRLNGLELVRKIKADLRLQSLPVVIVSYKDREEDRLRGLEAGANYYLTKSSFHDDTLVQAVRELIGEAVA